MFNWSRWPNNFSLSSTASFNQDFPNLLPQSCVDEFSDPTREYNCIAWAAGDTSAWWEPDPLFQYFWPDGVRRDYSLTAYIEAFRTANFEICRDGVPEADVEKIVIYTLNGEPKHAARQLPNGNWSSKFGNCEDVQHINLLCISGPLYGTAGMYMQRRKV